MSFLGDILNLSGASTSGGSSKSGGKSSGYNSGPSFGAIDISLPEGPLFNIPDTSAINIPTPNLAPVQQAVETATRPTSFSGLSDFIPSGSIGNTVSNAGSAITEAVQAVTPNLDQDFKAPVVEAVQAINVPRPNIEQDLTKANMADVQEAFVDAGSAVQAQVIESGGAGQQALIDAASATQTNAIVLGTNLTGGQSNPALEQEASNITKGVEGSIATETKGLESSIQTEVKGYEATVDKEVKGLEASLATEVKGIEQIPTDIANWNIDFAQKFDQSLDKDEDKYSSTTTPMANLDATEATGNEDPFADIETSTTKADKLTEEERLRRIRRLMLNRYGREDTILTGAKDPLNRRRYASAL